MRRGRRGAASRPRIGGVSREFRAVRLRHRRRGHRVPGAGAGRGPRPTSRCWCACRPPACCATCSARRRIADDQPATVPLRMIEEAGAGILLYVFPRGRASLVADFKRSRWPRRGRRGGASTGCERTACATSAWARRCWRTSACGTIRLLTNNPRRIVGLERLRHRGRRVRPYPRRPRKWYLCATAGRRQEVGMSRAASKASSYGTHAGRARGRAEGQRAAVRASCAARFNDFIVDRLIDGALDGAAPQAGAADERRRAVPLPGRDGAAGAGAARGRQRALRRRRSAWAP